MYSVLYRKYRPQLFSEIVGQEHIKVTLQNEIIQQRLAHAYLFYGPRGVAKTSTARVLAKAVNCEKRDEKSAEPCNTCNNCHSIMEGNALDYIEIDAASHTGVDHVREHIIENSRIVPTRAPYKIFVIDEVHMLSISAFNALLKILEEPPTHVIFILATTEIRKVPATIISRCQRFDFRKIEHDTMVTRLADIAKKEKIKIDDDVLNAIARKSLGHQRDAESILSQIFSLGKKSITAETASFVLPPSKIHEVWECIRNIPADPLKNIQLFETLLSEGSDIQQFTRESIEFLRQLLLMKTSKKLDSTISLDLDQKTYPEIIEFLKTISGEELLELLELFMKAEQQLKSDQCIIQLPLELIMIRWNQRKNPSPTPKKIEQPVQKPPRKSEEEKPMVEKEIFFEKTEKQTVKNLMSKEEVEKLWPDVLKKLQERNHSLTLSLKTGKVSEITDKAIVMTFGYKFHRDFVSKDAQRTIVEKIIKDISGNDWILKCELDETQRQQEAQTVQKEEMKEALEIFGGQVVG